MKIKGKIGFGVEYMTMLKLTDRSQGYQKGLLPNKVQISRDYSIALSGSVPVCLIQTS